MAENETLKHANKQLELLNAAKTLETAASNFLYLSMRVDSPEVDEVLNKQVCEIISSLRQHRSNALVPNSFDEDGKDEYVHPFCKNFHKKHEE